MRQRKHLTLEMQRNYLDKLRETGQPDLAASCIDVSSVDVTHYMEHDDLDGDFAAAAAWASRLYSADLAYKIELAAIEGQKTIRRGREGEEDVEEVKYETALRVKVLEKHGVGYSASTDTQKDANTGVLVVPTVVKSIDEWANLVNSVKGNT